MVRRTEGPEKGRFVTVAPRRAVAVRLGRMKKSPKNRLVGVSPHSITLDGEITNELEKIWEILIWHLFRRTKKEKNISLIATVETKISTKHMLDTSLAITFMVKSLYLILSERY
jgi:hypothetical protein